jgi:hypothetical protein
MSTVSYAFDMDGTRCKVTRMVCDEDGEPTFHRVGVTHVWNGDRRSAIIRAVAMVRTARSLGEFK